MAALPENFRVLPENFRSAELIEVIHVECSEGDGDKIPFHRVDYYLSKQGALLAKYDHWKASQ